MVKRDELIKYIHKTIGKDLLEKVQGLDTLANGVQILGKEEVSKVALGVSAHLDFFEEAVKAGAEFCVFHHGLGLSDRYIYNSRPDIAWQKRMKLVFENGLTVAGYHASLDMQPEFGNNATLIKLLGAKPTGEKYFMEYGQIAEFSQPQEVKKLAKKCSEILSNDVFAVYGGKDKVKRIGVCSGGGKPYGKEVVEIMEKGIELHITGEISESGVGMAKDLELNYFAGGHYATEVFGVQELGKKIKAEFKDKLEVEFIDIPNPI